MKRMKQEIEDELQRDDALEKTYFMTESRFITDVVPNLGKTNRKSGSMN